MASRNPDVAVSQTSRTESQDAGQIRLQVERVLASPPFRTSRRCQALLRHITERTLGGDVTSLKERTLGIEVFGRSPDYDTNDDPVVRATAGEIRKKLAQYYQEPNRAGEIRIELHPGSYVPEFHPAEVAAPTPAPAPKHSKTRMALFSAAALAVLASAAVLIIYYARGSEFDEFWQPLLDAPNGVLLCIGQPRAYNFRSDDRQRQIENMLEGMAPGALETSREMIPLHQLVPMWDRYTTVGDAISLLRIASVFEKRGKHYRIRGEAGTTFSDLRERPTVLIGAFDNHWTLRTFDQMRYTFYKDFQGLELVRDRQHPEKTDWKLLRSWPYWNVANDYAIVARIFDSNSDRVMVVAAGITTHGTEAAGEFLSDPQYFAEVVPHLPQGWQKKNLEIVLRIPVINGAAGHGRVLTTYTW